MKCHPAPKLTAVHWSRSEAWGVLGSMGALLFSSWLYPGPWSPHRFLCWPLQSSPSSGSTLPPPVTRPLCAYLHRCCHPETSMARLSPTTGTWPQTPINIHSSPGQISMLHVTTVFLLTTDSGKLFQKIRQQLPLDSDPHSCAQQYMSPLLPWNIFSRENTEASHHSTSVLRSNI